MATSSQSAEAPPAYRGRGWLLAAVTALYVARPLVPNDPVTDRGDGAVFAILWLVLATAWLLCAGFRRRLTVRWGAVDLALLSLIAWHSLSGLVAVWQASPRPAIDVGWQWFALATGFFLVRQLVVTAAETRAIVVAMIALAAALAALGIYQRCYSYPRDRARYERIKDDPGQMITTVGEYFPPGSPERLQFESRLKANEPTATFALTNSLAGYLAPWLVVAAGLAWVTWSAAGRRIVSSLGLGVLAVPIAGTLALTGSRSGLLAASAGLALLWPACRRRGWPRRWCLAAGMAIGLAVVAMALLTGGGIDRQLLAGPRKSLGYRLEYWRSTVTMIGDHPWLGCGPGQFQDLYTRYKLPQASEEIRDPHNFVLEVSATAGSPAALLLIVALALFAYQLSAGHSDRARERPRDDSTKRRRQSAEGLGQPNYVVVGAAGGWVLAALVGPLAGFPLELAPTALTAIVLGASWLLCQPWVIDRDSESAGRQVAVVAAVGAVTLLVNLLAAGGIGYPGVAGTLWLLLAVGLNGTTRGGNWTILPRFATVVGIAVAGLLLSTCYFTAYRPVLRSRASITRAQLAADPAQIEQRLACLQQAVRADPLSREASQMLAAERFRQWQAEPTSERLGLLRAAVARATRLAPRASSFWSQTGQWWLAVAQTSGAEVSDAMKWALDAHVHAVRCYPNRALLRARYAVALEVANRLDAARQQAAVSLQLDAIAHRAGHRDKWLDGELRASVVRIAEGLN